MKTISTTYCKRLITPAIIISALQIEMYLAASSYGQSGENRCDKYWRKTNLRQENQSTRCVKICFANFSFDKFVKMFDISLYF